MICLERGYLTLKEGVVCFEGKSQDDNTMGQLLWDLNGYIGSRPQLPSPIKEIKLISLQSYLPFFLYFGWHLNKALYKILVRIIVTVPFQPGMHGGSKMNYIDRTERMCILILNYLQYVGPARGEKKVVYKIRHLHPHHMNITRGLWGYSYELASFLTQGMRFRPVKKSQT